MTFAGRIQNWLQKKPDWFFIAYTGFVAFAVYSSMYAFRKPFTVATYDDQYVWGLHLKIWFIAAQVLGYTVSKFIGIKVVSEMPGQKRAASIIALVLLAEIALLLFALVPGPAKILFLFMNGLPLGMIWGLVFAYLEGRKYTEILGAVLSTSFIFASGFVKTVGKWLMVDWGVSEYWMPFVTGLLFLLPLVLFVFLIDQVPRPNNEDIALRTERRPMKLSDRLQFFNRFATAIVLLILAYAGLSIFREMRDNFAAEIWAGLGYTDDPQIFTASEIPVGIGTLLVLGLFSFIKDNTLALYANIAVIIVGFLMIGAGAFAFQKGSMSGLAWMILTGLGLYLAYIPFNALLFERIIAAFKYPGNIGFVMYLADSFGYLSSIASFSLKNFFSPNLSWINFFISSSYYISSFGSVLMLMAAVWFRRQKRQQTFALNLKI
ncbi:MAG: DUF5690 family protein [Mangrovibacterium sp.]